MTRKIINYLKSTILLIALGCALISAHAQTTSVRPYMGEQEVTAKLFNLDEPEINYHFTAELPGGNFVIIEWDRLSDWNNKADLQHIISLARTYAEQVQDSFKYSTTAKRMDIHIPMENEPVTVRVCEHTVTNNILLLKGNLQTPLKVNMDTIRIIKTIGSREIKTVQDDKLHKERHLVQMQYTLLLKDIDQVKNVDADNATISNISNKFDSVVHKYRHRWFVDDKWTHNLTVDYFPSNENPKKQMTVKKEKLETDKGRYYRAFEGDWGVGATIFRNQVCPVSDVGISYKWPARYSMYNFIRVSAMAFPDFVWNSHTDFDVYPLDFFNVEFGTIKSRQNAHIPLYQVSFGFGYMFNTMADPTFKVQDPTLRSFVSFKLSKMFTVTLETYGPYTGLTGMVRLF